MRDDDGEGYPPREEDESTAMIQEEEGNGRFDPTPYMRQLRGRGGQGQEYLDVKWRLLWLRREHPDAEIVTEHVRIDDGMAIFKATVSLPSGGKATGYGSETAGDFADFIEKAETKAIGRALNALGYGAQFSERGEEEATPPLPPRPMATPRPITRPTTPPTAPPTPATPPPSATVAAPPTPAAQPTPVAPPAPAAQPTPAAPHATVEAEPAPTRGERAQARDESAPPAPIPIRPPAEEETDMAEVSWNAFWAWARTLGFRRRDEVESFLGRPINDLTPGEVRNLIRAKRGDA